MFLPMIIYDYFLWHYTRAWIELYGIWKNFIWFSVHFFSIPELMRSWFSPFKRITEGRGQTFNLEDLASYIIINLISRIIGAIARTIIILLGCVAVICVLVGGILVSILWLLLPLVFIILLGAAISLFFISL